MAALFLDENKTHDDGDNKENGKKSNRHVHHAILYISLPSLHHCDIKLPNFTRSLYGLSEQNIDVVFFFNKLSYGSFGFNPRKFRQIKWHWIRSMKFEAVQIHFLSDFFGLLSSKNFATTAMWHNDFSCLLSPHVLKGIQDSSGFWIPRRGFWIPGIQYQILCQWNLDARFQSLD